MSHSCPPTRFMIALALASALAAAGCGPAATPPAPGPAAEPATTSATSATGSEPATASTTGLPSAGFDEAADPVADLARTRALAAASGRRILMKVGGNWCVWCRAMAGFLAADPEVASILDRGFVLLKVNVSKANKNEAFLAGFPKVEGYPFLFVLDAAGTVLHAQETGSLESGKGYDRGKFLAFLSAWSPVAPKR